MSSVFIIEVTTQRGWAGEHAPARVEVHSEAFKTEAAAERCASLIESNSRFGCSTVIIELPIR